MTKRHHATAHDQAVKAETERLKAISEAGRRHGPAYKKFAEHLAYETDLTAEQAVKCLDIQAETNRGSRPAESSAEAYAARRQAASAEVVKRATGNARGDAPQPTAEVNRIMGNFRALTGGGSKPVA